MHKDIRIGIIGGGPTGLMAGLELQRLGFTKLCIYEKHPERLPNSKSIGIHSPSLELFDRLGIAEEIVAESSIVKRGEIYLNGSENPAGLLEFDRLNSNYGMVALRSQSEVEHIMEEHYVQRGGLIKKGYSILALATKPLEWSLEAESYTDDVDFVVLADGYKSAMATQLGIQRKSSSLPDHYAMADFDDTLQHEPIARLFLHSEGIIESFPLNNNKRRWVARFENEPDVEDAQALAKVIEERTNRTIEDHNAHYFSRFNPGIAQSEHYFHPFGAVLMGDAAQVVSPIGGQGMNLGWMQAAMFATAFSKLSTLSLSSLTTIQTTYAKPAQALGTKIIRQSLFNTWMGRKGLFHLKSAIARSICAVPQFEKIAAHRFSMQWAAKRYL